MNRCFSLVFFCDGWFYLDSKPFVVFMDLVFGTWVPNVFQNCKQHGILLGWYKLLQMFTWGLEQTYLQMFTSGLEQTPPDVTWGLVQTYPDVYLRVGTNTSRCLPEGWYKHLQMFIWGLEQTPPDVYLRVGTNTWRGLNEGRYKHLQMLPQGWNKYLQMFTWGFVHTLPDVYLRFWTVYLRFWTNTSRCYLWVGTNISRCLLEGWNKHL